MIEWLQVKIVELTALVRAGFTLRSYLQTAAKNGVNLLDALERLFRGTPWIPRPGRPKPLTSGQANQAGPLDD